MTMPCYAMWPNPGGLRTMSTLRRVVEAMCVYVELCTNCFARRASFNKVTMRARKARRDISHYVLMMMHEYNTNSDVG